MGELYAVAAAITWAFGSLLFARIGRDGVPPGAMNLGKLIVAGALLSLTALALTGHVVPLHAPASALLLLTLSGLAGLSIGDTAYFSAIVALGVPRAILLLSSAPVFAALGGFLWLGETLDARSLLGMALVFGGITLVVVRPDAPGESSTRGIVFGVIAALGQAAGSLLSRRAMQVGLEPLAAAVGRILTGGVGLYVIALLTRDAVPWTRALFTRRTFVRVGLASLVGTYAGIWLAQHALLKTRSTGVATTLLATSPVFALPLAHLAGNERMTLRAVLGVLVTIAGIAVLSIR